MTKPSFFPFIEQFLIGDMRNFIYLITFENGNAYVVDPQYDLSPWEEYLGDHVLVGVLLTHTHHDHVGGVPEILTKYPNSKIFVHPDDLHRVKKIPENRLSILKNGETLENGSIEVLHTPGHSKGECSFFMKKACSAILNRKGEVITNSGTDFFMGPHLFSGDTVFIGNIGRTDFVGGSNQEMFETLQRLRKLPSDTLILSGHDYGKECVNFLQDELEYSDAWQCKTVEELAALP